MKSDFPQRVEAELLGARSLHGNQKSVHESYAVILEEVDEFWTEVKKKTADRHKTRMVDELVQIAAMCQRAAEDVLFDGLSWTE